MFAVRAPERFDAFYDHFERQLGGAGRLDTPLGNRPTPEAGPPGAPALAAERTRFIPRRQVARPAGQCYFGVRIPRKMDDKL
jgi:hypothetical protein